jgi:hypothetical protein
VVYSLSSIKGIAGFSDFVHRLNFSELNTGTGWPTAPFCKSRQPMFNVGDKVLTVMESSVFWDTMLCNQLKVNRRFGGTCRIHLADFFTLLGLFFDPEDTTLQTL